MGVVHEGPFKSGKHRRAEARHGGGSWQIATAANNNLQDGWTRLS